jgi:hypothetical protein
MNDFFMLTFVVRGSVYASFSTEQGQCDLRCFPPFREQKNQPRNAQYSLHLVDELQYPAVGKDDCHQQSAEFHF